MTCFELRLALGHDEALGQRPRIRNPLAVQFPIDISA